MCTRIEPRIFYRNHPYDLPSILENRGILQRDGSGSPSKRFTSYVVGTVVSKGLNSRGLGVEGKEFLDDIF